jgi:hypothetical protein
MPTKKRTRYIPKHVKEEVMKRDRGQCRICGQISEYMEFDHITPFSKVSLSTAENIQLLCRKCNLKKHDKTPKCFRCGSWTTAQGSYCHSCGATQATTAIVKETSFEIPWRRYVRNFLKLLMVLIVAWMIYKQYSKR